MEDLEGQDTQSWALLHRQWGTLETFWAEEWYDPNSVLGDQSGGDVGVVWKKKEMRAGGKLLQRRNGLYLDRHRGLNRRDRWGRVLKELVAGRLQWVGRRRRRSSNSIVEGWPQVWSQKLGWWGCHRLKEPSEAGGPVGDGKKSRLIWVLLWGCDGACRRNDPALVPHSQLLACAFLDMFISLLTPYGLNTSNQIGPIVGAETHLVDLSALHACSSWWSVVSESSDHSPRSLAWLSKCFVPERREGCAVVILAHISTFRKSHTSESQRAPLTMLPGFPTPHGQKVLLYTYFTLLTLSFDLHYGVPVRPPFPTRHPWSPWAHVCMGRVTPLKEIPSVTLLYFCWILIKYSPEWGKAKKLAPWLSGMVAICKDKITKGSLNLGTNEGALFNRILSKPLLIPFYSSYFFVLFNFPPSGIKSLFSALCAPATSISPFAAPQPVCIDIHSQKITQPISW